MAKPERLRKDFERVIAKGRLAHSYLFFGPSRNESLRFAELLAMYVECGMWKSEISLIDAKVFDCSEDSGIATARELKYFFSTKSFGTHRRTAIITSLDKLTLSAQHAILKIAEEPPEHALLLATAGDPSTVIGTLASRFYAVYVAGEGRTLVSESALRSAREAIQLASGRGLGAFLKELLENDTAAEEFVTALFTIYSDRKKYWRELRPLVYRWSLMQQFNTNKKLQLEAALLSTHQNRNS
ncbi:MAG: hypothetical protein AAB407_00510 [Patescibacteria group bacterium]